MTTRELAKTARLTAVEDFAPVHVVEEDYTKPNMVSDRTDLRRTQTINITEN